MTELSRTEVSQGLLAEYAAFADLLDSLDDAGWKTATRCDGFDVRDVAGHVVGLAEDVVRGVPGSRTAVEEAASLRDFSASDVAKHLREATVAIGALADAFDDAAWAGPSPVDGMTMGHAVALLWYDAYVHADDVRAAVGLPSERGGGLRVSVEYLARELGTRDFAGAQLRLDGMPQLEIGTGGPTVTGDALQFVLAATGRADPNPLGLDSGVNIYAE